MAHPFIPFSNVCKVELVFSQYSQIIENTFHWRNDAGAFTATDMGDLAQFMIDWWSDHCKSIYSVDLSLSKYKARDLTTQISPSIEGSIIPAVAGTHNSPGLPTNVTAAIKFNTGFSGRSYRGRNYICGLAEDAVTGDTLDAGIVSQVITAYDLLLSAPPADWVLVVASQYNNGAWRTTGVATPVTTFTMDNLVDSQRRRLAGRGR